VISNLDVAIRKSCEQNDSRTDGPFSATCAASPDTTVEISVCIANWNCLEIVRNCLESLLRQPQGAVMEVVVVDNGSTDGAPEMIAAKFPEVVLIRNATNEGFSRANNRAARAARGRYLFFLNNDTIVPVHALAKLLAYATEHPEVGMIGPRLRNPDGSFQISYRRQPSVGALLHRTLLLRWTGICRHAYRAYRRGSYDPNFCGAIDLLMGAAVLMPRVVFNKCGGWDEEFAFGGEDLDLAVRVGRHDAVHFCSTVDVIHYGRVSSRLNAGFSAESVAIGYVRCLRKTGASPAALVTYKALVILDSPLQLLAIFAQWMLRRLTGRTAKAAKSRVALVGLVHFLRHSIPRFWRA
jgi:N-acetylglucosaminyl-diphospho-decaprenol L-rhamnosyltransferase